MRGCSVSVCVFFFPSYLKFWKKNPMACSRMENRFCLFSSFHLQKLLFLLQHASLGSGLSSLYALLNCFDCVLLCPSIKTFRSSDSLTWRQRVGLPSTKWLICNFPILSCIGFLFFGILNSNFIFVLDKEMKLEERGKELKVGE